MQPSTDKNPGATLCVTALVISILALLGIPVVFFIGTDWASFEDGRSSALALAIAWMFVCSLSVMLGMLGRKRSRAYGYKGGAGTAAMVIGLFAELLCVGVLYFIFQVESLT